MAPKDLFDQFPAEPPGQRARAQQETVIDRAKPMMYSGTFTPSGIKVAYLGTQRDLGVTLEVFKGLPDGKQKPGAM
jgi:hypothetical protein